MDRPEVRELEYVVAVAEELSFTRAAARLGIAQPPLSRAIGRLERRLGVALFVRTSRSVRVTAEGAAFIRDGRAVLGSLDAMVQRARAARQDRPVVVAVRATTGSGLLAAILERCAVLPEPLPVQVRFSRAPADNVRDHLADAALTCTTENTTGLRSEELDEQPTVALLAPGHPLADRTAIQVRDLLADPGYLGDCPEVPFDEMLAAVTLQRASAMVSRDVADQVGEQVRTVPITDAPPTVLSLAWAPGAAHSALSGLIRTARHTAYHYQGRMLE